MARWSRARYSYIIRRPRWKMRFPRLPIIIITVALIITIAILTFSIIDKNLAPAIISIAEARSHHMATEAINKAIYDKVLASINYNDLIIVHKDSQQRITMMQANSVRIARIVSQANLEIKNALEEMEDQIISVPLGLAFGSRILANHGPRIDVKISPYGTVDVKFVDEFQQAGINQVRHILYLDIVTTVRIIIPTVTENVVIKNRIPIAESIIVGEVPNTYVGFNTDYSNTIIDPADAER